MNHLIEKIKKDIAAESERGEIEIGIDKDQKHELHEKNIRILVNVGTSVRLYEKDGSYKTVNIDSTVEDYYNALFAL